MVYRNLKNQAKAAEIPHVSEPAARYQLRMVLPSPQWELKGPRAVDRESWEGSSLVAEASLQQIAPFVGKMKCTMAAALIRAFSNEGDTILDPFSGCGVVPLESLILNRCGIGNDLHPYAYTITRAKLYAPTGLSAALKIAEHYITMAEQTADLIILDDVPDWVRKFFHPRTLQETLALTTLLKAHEQWFLLGCVLGILQHVRPGFLSYPASHLTPYLREAMYPRNEHPKMYEYRDVRTRLLAKVERMYRRPVNISPKLGRTVLVDDARQLSLASESVDAIVSSPPYFDALDYGRDNRLRLWFLGVSDYRIINPSLIRRPGTYLEEMRLCLVEMFRVLKPGRYCVLVLGDVAKNGSTKNTAELIGVIARDLPQPFAVEALINDEIPDERRSRRRTSTTKIERILVLRKPQ